MTATADEVRPPLPAGSRPRQGTGTPFTRGLGIVALVAMAWVILAGLVLSPRDVTQGESVRIMYMHVPSAWLAYLAFVVTAFCSGGYLWRRSRSLVWDRIAGASAEVGVLFMGITLVTGMLWGRLTWGVYWQWDPRLTTTAFLFVTFVGYLAVRNLGGSHHQRARRSAVLGLLAALQIPLVHFSVVLWRSLHQEATVLNPSGEVQMEGLMLFTLFSGVVAFTVVYVWLVLHRHRVLTMEDMFDEQGLDLALAERRREAADHPGGGDA
jgi:heme exporter protein C